MRYADVASPSNPESGTLTDGTSTASFTEIEEVILGSGDDNVSTGDGADTVDGGKGNDVFTFDNDGNDTITDFGAGITGDETDGTDQTDNDFVDMSAYYDRLDELKADYADDGILNQSNTTTLSGKAVDYSDNTAMTGSLTLQGTTDAGLTWDTTNVICFTRGTMIKTIEGEKAVETLEQGDLVWTQDRGYQAIRWIGARAVSTKVLEEFENIRPIRIQAGALGGGLPKADLLVSPQHRMFLNSLIAERVSGQKEVLASARHLVQVQGIDIDTSCEPIEYWHFMFDQHEIVEANGSLSESLFTGPEALKAVPAEAREEILTLFPELQDATFSPEPARPLMSGRVARKLANRHREKGRALLRK